MEISTHPVFGEQLEITLPYKQRGAKPITITYRTILDLHFLFGVK